MKTHAAALALLVVTLAATGVSQASSQEESWWSEFRPPSPNNDCADGPVCRSVLSNALDHMEQGKKAVLKAEAIVGVTELNKMLALISRVNVGCIKQCLDVEESRGKCGADLRKSFDHHVARYREAVAIAQSASNTFDEDGDDWFKEGSSFMHLLEKHGLRFTTRLDLIDNCGTP